MQLTPELAAHNLIPILSGNHSGQEWKKELGDALKSFAFKYQELSPEATVTAPGDPQNHPSSLWHDFFVLSLDNMLAELPANVEELKEKIDELRGNQARRTEEERTRQLRERLALVESARSEGLDPDQMSPSSNAATAGVPCELRLLLIYIYLLYSAVYVLQRLTTLVLDV